MHHKFQDFLSSFLQIKQLKNIIFFKNKQLVQFIASQEKNIKHDMCPPCFTLFKIDPSKNSGLQYELHLKPHILIELCASNYCTNDGIVNGVEGFFKVATKSHSTPKIWIHFLNPII